MIYYDRASLGHEVGSLVMLGKDINIPTGKIAACHIVLIGYSVSYHINMIVCILQQFPISPSKVRAVS